MRELHSTTKHLPLTLIFAPPPHFSANPFACLAHHFFIIFSVLLAPLRFPCLPNFVFFFHNLSFSWSCPPLQLSVLFTTAPPFSIFLTLLRSYTPPFGRAGRVVDARGGLKGVKAESWRLRRWRGPLLLRQGTQMSPWQILHRFNPPSPSSKTHTHTHTH